MIVVILSFFFSFLFPQESSLGNNELIKELDKSCESITTDRLGNLYLINDYRITMYNKAGDSLREFNSRKFGQITFVDATDPYKILVFFEDYNLIVYLDNFLSQNGDPLDLQELGYDQISFACQSREKGIWLFDPLRQKLIKLNQNFKPTHESINLAQWFGTNIQPDYMIELNNQLFINQKDNGFYVFDHFGTFMKRIQLNKTKSPQVMDGKINYLNSDSFCQYNMKSFETICDSLSVKSLTNVRVEQGRTYLKTKNKVHIFKAN